MDNRPSTLILVADDDEEDCMLEREAMEESGLVNALHFVHDGEELMDYLYHRDPFTDRSAHPDPGLILLDLNMPKKDGREALREIKADDRLRRIPIIVLTTSKAEEDILKTYHLGVSSFITKPVTFEGLVNVMKALSTYWFQIVELPPQLR